MGDLPNQLVGELGLVLLIVGVNVASHQLGFGEGWITTH